MRHILRTLTTIVAALAVVFSGVAVAQDGDPVAECEARGGEWFDWGPGAPSGCSLDHPEEYGRVLELRALVAQRDECEAAGGMWSVGRDPFLAPIYHCDLPGEVASGTAAEPAPSAPLPTTEPAPASQGAPQYTG